MLLDDFDDFHANNIIERLWHTVDDPNELDRLDSRYIHVDLDEMSRSGAHLRSNTNTIFQSHILSKTTQVAMQYDIWGTLLEYPQYLQGRMMWPPAWRLATWQLRRNTNSILDRQPNCCFARSKLMMKITQPKRRRAISRSGFMFIRSSVPVRTHCIL